MRDSSRVVPRTAWPSGASRAGRALAAAAAAHDQDARQVSPEARSRLLGLYLSAELLLGHLGLAAPAAALVLGLEHLADLLVAPILASQ